MRLLLILTINVALACGGKTSKKDLSNGFGTEIDWVNWDNAVGVAKDLNKPIFFLIHKTWCGACRGLKHEFNTSSKTPDLVKLSKKFVMVNVEDDDEPEDEKYAPDGGYIPRILFLDTDAEPLKTNNEAKYKNNKYFYPLVPQVIDGMERALMEFEAHEEEKKRVGEKIKEMSEDNTTDVEEDEDEDDNDDDEDGDGDEEEYEEDEEKHPSNQETNKQDIDPKKIDGDEKKEAVAEVKSKKESEKRVDKEEDKESKDGNKGEKHDISDIKNRREKKEENKEMMDKKDGMRKSDANKEEKPRMKEHKKQEL